MRYIIPLLALAALIAGCSSVRAPVVPPTGFIYTNYRAPLDVNYSGAAMDGRQGTSTAKFLQVPFTYGTLSFSWGDASVETAAKAGGIRTVQAADYEYTSVLGVYAEMTSIVYGDGPEAP